MTVRAKRQFLLPALLLLVCLPIPAGAAIVEEIVAKINNRIITKSEFEERGQALIRQIYQQYFGEELDREIQTAQDGLLANLISENLRLERAETIFDIEKIRVSLISQFRKQQKIDGDEELQKLLEEQGMTRKELEDQLIRMEVPQEIINYDVRRKISVSERETQNYYDNNLQKWETVEQITFREIVLFYERQNRFDVEGRMEVIRRELDQGADFVELVRRYSEAGTRESDGLLGPLPRKDLHPAIAAGAFHVEAGNVSEPIDTGKSIHLLKIENRIDRHVKEASEVREEIQKAVRQQKFAVRYQQYLRKLWKENEIEIMPKYERYLIDSPLTANPDAVASQR